MTRTLLAAAFALLVSPAAAQVHVPISFQPEPDFEDLVRKGVEAFAPKDAFSARACAVVDAKTLRPFDQGEAALALGPCLEEVSKRYGLPVSARPGIVSKDAQGLAEVGLVLKVGGRAPAGSASLRDLNHSLALRRDRLLGHKAVLRRGAEAGPWAASSAQGALERCLTPSVLRKVTTAQEFLTHYGACLLKDEPLRAVDARPLGGDPLALAVTAKGEESELKAMNGYITVMAEDGPVSLLVVSFPAKAD